MKILVFAHRMEVGGSQTNAIDLASALRDTYGHEVILFATPGPMVKVSEERGLRFIPAPKPARIPSLAMMRALRQVIRDEQPDVIQVWDWWQGIDAYLATNLIGRVPLIVSDTLSEKVTDILPRTPLTTYGTPEFVDLARASKRRRVEPLVPPVDVHFNAPGVVDGDLFRQQRNIDSGDITLVTVSRLTRSLKGESLCRTIDAVRTLGREFPLRFVIVGDGDLRPTLARLADETNAALGRTAVSLTGELLDPRPAYAAADIVVGMGGSALRGMAFAKPVVVVGERGFSGVLTPETAASFYYHGMYGIGNNEVDNARLVGNLRTLLEKRDTLPALGAFSRQFVVDHFALETVCADLDRYCREAITERTDPFSAMVDGVRLLVLLWRGRLMGSRAVRLVKRCIYGRQIPAAYTLAPILSDAQK